MSSTAWKRNWKIESPLIDSSLEIFFCNDEHLFYVKLQDAYAAEKDTLGTWYSIGYTAPGTVSQGTASTAASSKSTNFSYKETVGETETWTASNNSKLNDCAADSKAWTVTTTKNTGNDAATLGALKHVAAVSKTGCDVLTPTFEQIGNSK